MTAAGGRSRGAAVRLLLLRHGQVASHRGDTPLIEEGRETAARAGRSVGPQVRGRLVVLTNTTLRTRQTAELFVQGAREASGSRSIDEPWPTFALRNPDMYAGGERIDLVSSPEGIAEQVRELSVEQCARLPFFAEFMRDSDRIGWWLRHLDPPGEDGSAVAARVMVFALSLLDVEPQPDDLYVGVTHSPILRAVTLAHSGYDPGELPCLTGLALHVRHGKIDIGPFTPFEDDLASGWR